MELVLETQIKNSLFPHRCLSLPPRTTSQAPRMEAASELLTFMEAPNAAPPKAKGKKGGAYSSIGGGGGGVGDGYNQGDGGRGGSNSRSRSRSGNNKSRSYSTSSTSSSTSSRRVCGVCNKGKHCRSLLENGESCPFVHVAKGETCRHGFSMDGTEEGTCAEGAAFQKQQRKDA